MTRREAINVLKTEQEIQCLDARAYVELLALKLELEARGTIVQAKILAPKMKHWQMKCLLCANDKVWNDLVAIQEHAMSVHGYTQADHRNATKTEKDEAYTFSFPDGKAWMEAKRESE